MADFSQLLKQSKKAARAPRVLELPPSAWADTREDKPQDPVKIGIRLISEADTQIARSSAARIAVDLQPVGTEEDRIEAYNNALMRFAAEYGTCQPHDADQPYFILGELDIRERLTPEGVRRLWHEIEALHIASNPSLDEADDEAIAHLVALLHHDALDRVDKPDAQLVRRLLEMCRSVLAEAPEATG